MMEIGGLKHKKGFHAGEKMPRTPQIDHLNPQALAITPAASAADRDPRLPHCVPMGPAIKARHAVPGQNAFACD
jgi:hypothetical protein